MNLYEMFDHLSECNTGQRADFLTDLAKRDAKRAETLARMLIADKADALPEPSMDALLNVTQEIQVPIAPVEGRVIGGFALLRSLGRGGMGEVWLAQRQAGSAVQQVAIKILRVDIRNHEAKLRFSLEQRLIASLDHPFVARMIDAGDADGAPWIAMEYVDGAPILSWCDEHKLGVRARIALMLQVLEAVAHAHDHLIVHRDLKSSNVMVTSDGRPKLLDFGIAKVIGDTKATSTAQRFFSLGSVAPEQYSGERTSIATDVYQLGILLFELLVGAAPYPMEGLSPEQIQTLIMYRPPELPSRSVPPEAASLRGLARAGQLARVLEGELDLILMYALRKNPTERYRSTVDFARDLQAFLDGRPVLASGQSAGYRAKKFLRRHWLPTSLAATALACLLGLVLQLVMRDAALSKARIEAVAARDQAQQERDKANNLNSFLLELFRAANPTASVKKDLPSIVSDAIALELNRQQYTRDPGTAIALVKAALGLGELAQARKLTNELQRSSSRYSNDEQRQILFLRANIANINADFPLLIQINADLARNISGASLEQQVLFIGYVGQTQLKSHPEKVLQITAISPLPATLIRLRARALTQLGRDNDAVSLLKDASASKELTPLERLGILQSLTLGYLSIDQVQPALSASTAMIGAAKALFGTSSKRLAPYLNTQARVFIEAKKLHAAIQIFDSILATPAIDNNMRLAVQCNRALLGTMQDQIDDKSKDFVRTLWQHSAAMDPPARKRIQLSALRVAASEQLLTSALAIASVQINNVEVEEPTNTELKIWMEALRQSRPQAAQIEDWKLSLSNVRSQDVQLIQFLNK